MSRVPGVICVISPAHLLECEPNAAWAKRRADLKCKIDQDEPMGVAQAGRDRTASLNGHPALPTARTMNDTWHSAEKPLRAGIQSKRRTFTSTPSTTSGRCARRMPSGDWRFRAQQGSQWRCPFHGLFIVKPYDPRDVVRARGVELAGVALNQIQPDRNDSWVFRRCACSAGPCFSPKVRAQNRNRL